MASSYGHEPVSIATHRSDASTLRGVLAASDRNERLGIQGARALGPRIGWRRMVATHSILYRPCHNKPRSTAGHAPDGTRARDVLQTSRMCELITRDRSFILPMLTTHQQPRPKNKEEKRPPLQDRVYESWCARLRVATAPRTIEPPLLHSVFGVHGPLAESTRPRL